MKKKILYILILIITTAIASAFFIYFKKNKDLKEIKFEKVENVSILNQELFNKNKTEEKEIQEENLILELEKKEEKGMLITEENNTIEEQKLNKVLPDKIHHQVDFVSQSPFAKWDELHEEACEEASLIIVYYYLSEKILTKEKMEKEIQDLVEFQNEEYGDYKDSSMEELKKIAENYYDIKNIKLIEDFEIKDLKSYLADGHLIIVPTAGRELNNPNFTPPGSLYHNLVLIGYDDKREIFITNDPGTRNGKNYIYNYKILYNAIHDFPGEKSEILEGNKKVLIF